MRFGIRRTFKLVGLKGVFYALRGDWKKARQGAREMGGAREFLRVVVRVDWVLWVGFGWALFTQEFWFLAVIAGCAVIGASTREWSLRSYKKMLDGYGTMVDQQQSMIAEYQSEPLHPSEQSAKARVARMN